jgi:citrate synthase
MDDETAGHPVRKPWWETSIVEVKRNWVLVRGYPIEDLIGRLSYAEMLYLEVMGDLPDPEIARLLEAALVAACDFGLYSPAIASTRMAVTCGISFNSALANGVNVLGDIHGGATEEGMRLYYSIARRWHAAEGDLTELIEEACRNYRATARYLPGFGHPVNDDDPRVRRLLELGDAAAESDVIGGEYLRVARTFEQTLARLAGRRIPMNVDGALSAIQCEIGLPAEIAKGLISLSRGIGLVAHAFEELQSGSRLKAPCPPDVMSNEFVYTGPRQRALPEPKQRPRPPAASTSSAETEGH